MHPIDLDNRDPEFLKLSPTGKVPLLVDGDFKLYESQVINDYVAEKLAWGGAYAEDIELRARQRLAMNRWDASFVPLFYGSLRDPAILEGDRAKDIPHELDELQKTVVATGAVECLLGFHVAPFWARMTWLREFTDAARFVEQREALRAWLDRTIAIPAVQQTLPDREATVARYRERFAAR